MIKKRYRLPVAFVFILLLCLSSTVVWADVASPAEPEQIVLSFTGDSGEMAVTWCDAGSDLGSPSGSTAVYGTHSDLSGAYTVSADTTVSVNGMMYYEATMTRLSPGEQYYYQVGTPGRMSDIRSFTTGDREGDYKFIYLGDVQFKDYSTMNGEFDAWSSLVQNAYDANPSAAFLLQGGDMVNKGQVAEEWQALLTRVEDTLSRVPFLSVPGNHECNDEATGKPELWSKIFDLPKNGPSGFEEEFYSFDYGDSHILCLNSNIYSNEQLDKGAMDTADFERIKTWIASDLGETDKTWKIVALHHPPYVVVDDRVSAEILNQWVPIFEDNGVSLVLCGHQHVYMRTFTMFDREVSTDDGITYIMGDSGSKFYSKAEVPYDACMLENTSTYQTVSVASDGITVETYGSSGALLDSTVVTEPTAADHEISLNYNSSEAIVTAPSTAASGSAVTINVSNRTAGKEVYDVSVKDKNGKSYPVTTLAADSSYSFVMPNRSVRVEVLFEGESGGGEAGDKEYYSYSVSTGDDPIWSINVRSSGLTEDNSKIKAGETVTVSVARDAAALSSSLEGINVRSSSTAVPVTTVSTTKGSYGKIKGGNYQFTMPDGSVSISVEADCETLKVYARKSESDSYSLKKTFDKDDLVSGSNVYYTGYDRYPTAVIGKADQYITLEELLKSCDIELTESSSIALTALDGASKSFHYDELYGKTRYYYPNIKSGSASGKKAIEPMLVVKGYQDRFINLKEKSIDDMAPDTQVAYRFVYGQTPEQFNDGTASEKYATIGDFLKWTNNIKVTGYQSLEEEPDAPGAGGGVAIEAEVAVAKGKAEVTPEISAVKDSLSKALKSAKTEKTVPKISINVPMQEGLQSVEVNFSKLVLQALTEPDELRVTVSTPFGGAEFNEEILKILRKEAGDKNLKVAIASVEQNQMKNNDERELTGNNVELSVAAGSRQMTKFGEEKVTIRIPFKPDDAKKLKGYYAVWFPDSGESLRMPGSAYNEADKAVIFETDHLSVFGVAYTDNTAVNLFSDVKEDSWYAPYASFVTENGCFQGTSDTTFGPDGVMTRAMLVTVLGRLHGAEATDSAPAFTDVKNDAWYADSVTWAEKEGIAAGIGSGRFGPDRSITREQLAVMLYQCAKLDNGTVGIVAKQDLLKYKDFADVSAWAQDALAWACHNGLITGRTADTLAPKETAARAEVAAIITRYSELINKK